LRVNKRFLSEVSLIGRIGGVVEVGLFIAIHNPFTVITYTSALTISEFINISVSSVIAIDEVSVKRRLFETPSVICAVAIHLTINTLVLVVVWPVSL
jgi:hypothetical protein